jgi:5-hydroxyisourate hydrolase
MGLSTHILDTSLGRPAVNVSVALLKQAGSNWSEVGRGVTDPDGRCRTLLGDTPLERTNYKLRFEIAPYFATQSVTSLYPYIEIVFAVAEASQHYHIPLLLTANGYTTYRGS